MKEEKKTKKTQNDKVTMVTCELTHIYYGRFMYKIEMKKGDKNKCLVSYSYRLIIGITWLM